MTKKRPTGVTVFAILSIVFGSLGLVCTMCGAVGLAANPALQNMQQQGQQQGQAPFGQNSIKYMEDNVPGYKVFMWGSVGLGMIFAALLIAVGVGLLNMQRWARVLAIVYSFLNILVNLGNLAYTIALVNPAQNEWFAKQGMPMPGGVLPAISIASTFLGVAFAVAMLIYMLLPATSQAFSGTLRQDMDADESDDDDPDFERKRREPRSED